METNHEQTPGAPESVETPAAPVATPVAAPAAPWKLARLGGCGLGALLGLYLISTSSQVAFAMRIASFMNRGALGATGEMLGYCCIVAAVCSIYAHFKNDARGILAAAIVYAVGVLFSLDVGLYGELYLWDIIVTVIAVLHLIPWLKARKAAK